MTEVVKKPWGYTAPVFQDPYAELWAAYIKPGGFSSRHWHNYMSNTFEVLEGELVILCFDNKQRIRKEIRLTPEHRPVWVPPRVLHQFLAPTDVALYEFYKAAPGREIVPGDIHRLTENGCDKSIIELYKND